MAAPGRTNGHSRGPDTFVHLDLISAFSRLQSPSTPQDYVSALIQQFPLNEQSASQPRPAIALCDWGLHSAVKMAVACARAGVDHLPGLRVRVVPEAAWHPGAEQPRELLLLAGDEEAWLSLVALSNKAYLANGDFRGPRLDWRDLEEHSAGELICLTGGPLVSVLTPLIEQAADPSNPVEEVALASRLNELYSHVFVELAYHGQPREKLVNRGLVALAHRLDPPLVAANAGHFARAGDSAATPPTALNAFRMRASSASRPMRMSSAGVESTRLTETTRAASREWPSTVPIERHHDFGPMHIGMVSAQ